MFPLTLTSADKFLNQNTTCFPLNIPAFLKCFLLFPKITIGQAFVPLSVTMLLVVLNANTSRLINILHNLHLCLFLLQ